MESTLTQVRATLYAMWRKRWYGLAALWAVCLVGWIAVAFIPNEYRSQARVFVRVNRELTNVLEVGKAASPLSQVNVVRQTLTSRPNLEKVLRRTDVDLTGVEGAELEGRIAALASNIRVAPQGSRNLYQLSFVADDPSMSNGERAAFAQQVVQNLINLFVEGNVEDDRDALQQSQRFLDEQIAQRERQLEEAESRRRNFEVQYFGLLPGEGDITDRMVQAQRELENVDQALIQARSSLGTLQGQIGATAATLRGPSVARPGAPGEPIYNPASARGKIQALEKQITDAMVRGYTEKHPDIVTARAQIGRLQAEAAKEPAAAAGGGYDPGVQSNPVYVNLRSLVFDKQSQVAALAARKAQLTAALSDLRSKQTEQPGLLAQYTKLTRDYGVLRAGYQNLLQSRERIRLRADVATQTDQVQFRTIDPPTLPSAPEAPNRPMLITLVLLGGLAAGLAVAFVSSQLHPAYITEDRLAADTGLPVLGSVAEVVDEGRRAQARRWMLRFAGAAGALAAIWAVMLVAQFAGGGAA